MTIPYGMLGNIAQSGQIKNLLKQAKQQAGLLDEDETPQMPQTPAFNPNAPDPRQTSPMGDPTHAHRGGLIGRIGHAMGGDRVQPEMAAMLTPDQQSRVRRGPGGALLDYLVRGETTGEAQIRRGTEMLTLGDQRQTREIANATRVRREAIRMGMRPPPLDPKGQMEWYQELQARYTGAGLTEDASAINETLKVLEPKVLGQGQQLTGRSGAVMASVAPAPAEVARGAAVWNPETKKWDIPAPIAAEPKVIGGIMQGGKPSTVAVDPSTGRVMWSLPEVPPTAGGAGTGRPPTEAESKDYVFASMMNNAMPDIRATVDKIRPAIITAMRKDPIGVLDIAQTEDEKVFIRAVLEFTAAVNRKESGAAITPFEVSNTLDRYVDTGLDGAPDSPVRKAKAKARENFYRTMIRASARARAFYEGGAPDAGPNLSMTQAEFDQLSPAAQAAARSAGYTINP
jgi:hypothetical protein